MAPPIATVAIDSDWATFQLVTEGTTIQQVPGVTYPPTVIFTPTGVLYGQPNEQLKPQVVELQFWVIANVPTVNFLTGKGDSGTTGPQGGLITVTLANSEYTNTNITGDGLNFKVFYNAPIFHRIHKPE